MYLKNSTVNDEEIFGSYFHQCRVEGDIILSQEGEANFRMAAAHAAVIQWTWPPYFTSLFYFSPGKINALSTINNESRHPWKLYLR
jgi:hypothetical protein